MSKHTAGPWVFLDIGTVEAEDGTVIAECVVENNGPLLAASLDLLAAIELQLECLRGRLKPSKRPLYETLEQWASEAAANGATEQVKKEGRATLALLAAVARTEP